MNLLSAKEALEILRYLNKTQQAFCFFKGRLISRKDCVKILRTNNNQTA